MAKKTLPRVKSPEEVANETEYARRRNLPHVDIRFIGANDVVLSANGIEVASKSTITDRRGKVITVLYVLPSLAKYEALMALPVAR